MNVTEIVAELRTDPAIARNFTAENLTPHVEVLAREIEVAALTGNPLPIADQAALILDFKSRLQSQTAAENI